MTTQQRDEFRARINALQADLGLAYTESMKTQAATEPDYEAQIDYVTFYGDTLPEALDKLSRWPEIEDLDRNYVGALDVEYDEGDGRWMVSMGINRR